MPLDPAIANSVGETAGQAEVRPNHPIRKLLMILAGIILLIAAVLWAIRYITVGQYFVSTNDAYLAADTSMISAKISGYVTAVPVKDNQLVKQNQLLAVIDPRDYQAQLDEAQADAAAASAAIDSDAAQLDLQRTKIVAAAATVRGDQARAAFAALNQRRYASLSGSGASPVQTSDQAKTDLAGAQALVEADQAALLGANRSVDVLNATLAQAHASLAQSLARVQEAALNLSHTVIRAPFDGQVGNKSVAVGDYLQTGTQIMAVVPLSEVYVLANYKETQITHVVPGQKATVAVDGFPDLKVTGTVDSVAPSSGQEFALLPPDNATGNFTKIVQRVPVKIDLNLNADLIGKLRPGMSVEPDIDTRRGH